MFPGLESDSGSLISMSICSYVHVYACIYAIYACICMYHCYKNLYISIYVPVPAFICTYVHVLLVDREKNG
jgi:hypothetical protein